MFIYFCCRNNESSFICLQLRPLVDDHIYIYIYIYIFAATYIHGYIGIINSILLSGYKSCFLRKNHPIQHIYIHPSLKRSVHCLLSSSVSEIKRCLLYSPKCSIGSAAMLIYHLSKITIFVIQWYPIKYVSLNRKFGCDYLKE